MECELGIDASKGYCDVLAIGPGFKPLDDVLQFDDTRDGHRALEAWVRGLVQRFGITRLSCGVESTGGLENNWHAMLVGLSSQLPLRVARLNPSLVKDAAKAMHNPNLTDAVSAFNIASYLRRYHDKVDYRVQDTQYSAYRSLNNHISLVRKQRTQLVNEFKQLLYTGFPEILRYCKQGVPNWVLRLVRQYPSVGKLSRARPETVAKIKGITSGKAEKLIQAAKDSVSSRSTETDELLLHAIAEDIRLKDERILGLKAHLAKVCKGPEVTLLQTIKGIAAYSAAAIMVEIEDIGRFADPAKLASYFGIHPKIKVSGDKKAVSRMSKQGRPAIRATLFMCARSAARTDQNMKKTYTRHRENGKTDRQALGAIMHKLLRTIWGMLKSGKPYDPKIDINNQRRMNLEPERQEANEAAAKRRLQPYDAAAPISGRATKKRKALAASQSSNAENVRDLARAPRV